MVVCALVASSLASNAFAQGKGPGSSKDDSGTPGVVNEDDANGRKTLAEDDGVTVVQDGDWIRWNYVDDFGIDAIDTIYVGSKNKHGGCSYTGEDTVLATGAPDQVTIERQTSERPGSCIMVTEAKAFDIQQALSNQLIKSSDLGGSTDSHHDSASALTLESHLTLDGSIKIYYEDPPRIDVTSVTTKISWNKNSSCITATHKTSHWGWYSPSGWERREHRSNTEPDLCSEAWRNTYGKYRNGKFCLTIDTWTRLSATYVVYNSGNAVKASWSANKWGGCTFLLSFRKHFVHPW